jgi:hypothetical protein
VGTHRSGDGGERPSERLQLSLSRPAGLHWRVGVELADQSVNPSYDVLAQLLDDDGLRGRIREVESM